MAEIPKLNIVPLFLVAKTKEELVAKTIKNNAVNGKAYNYMNPMLISGEWVVWYYGDPFNDFSVDAMGKNPLDEMETIE